MKKEFLPYFILIIASTFLLFIGFPDVITHPNSVLMSDDLDAFKSYFNFSYYLRYGEGFKLKAVNYPYGDLLFYVNSHPVYHLILSWVEPIFPSIRNYGPAIINLSMLLSIVLSPIFIFKILRNFSLPIWYAVFAALIIQFNYPQFRRIFGHFEMVFALSFPLYWYFFIRFLQSEKAFKYAVILVIWNLFVGLIGAYLVAINSIFSIAVGLVLFYKMRHRLTPFLVKGFSIFFISFLPLLIIKFLVSTLDWVDDRPENPWGFYNFYASPESMLQPYYFENIFGIEFKTIFEGESYLGLPALVFSLTLLFVVIKSWIKRRPIPRAKFFPFRELNIYLLGALIVLIYAMCLPFRWGLDIIPDTFPILKQFRSLGRFSWPFYYVFTVFIAAYIYLIYRYLRQRRKSEKAILFLVSTLFVWCAETAYLYWDIFRIERPENEWLSPDDQPFLQALEVAGKEPNDFQALMSLPFMSTNGDKLIFWGKDAGLKGAMAFSYHTEIPIIQSVSPRLSFSESLSSIQFLSDEKISKTRLDDMTSDPLLVIYAPATLSASEKSLLSLTDSLTTWRDFQLRILYPSRLDSVYRKEYIKFQTLKHQYETGNLQQVLHYYFQSFNDREAVHTFTGKGAFYKRKGEHVLFSEDLSDMGFAGKVEFSLWMYIDERKSNMPDLIFREKNARNALVAESRINVRNEPNVVGRWVRPKKVFDVQPGSTYTLIVDGEFITIDDMLLRPVEGQVLIEADTNTYLWNNFPFE